MIRHGPCGPLLGTFGFSIDRRDGKLSLPKGAISGLSGLPVLLYLRDLTNGAEGIERFD
jgi:NTE family protein